MILRLLNVQGVAGLAATLALAVLLVVQKVVTRHWHQESARYERLYTQEHAAFAQTEANYRAAAEQARNDDAANRARVDAEQTRINQEQSDAYQTRIAAARALAERLRQSAEASSDPGPSRAAPVPGVSTSPGGPAQAAAQNRLPHPDALTATEQAIQLYELIKWVKAQASVDPNAVQK